jgi:capsular polysaccharide biosynthesis protein
MFVEISDYLRIIWRRLWILILVPLLAGGAVAAMVLREPPKYDATATVAAPAVVGGQSTNQYSGSTGPKAFVSNFVAAITSTRIVNQVAKETNVLPRHIRAGLVAAPIGESSIIEVTYTTTRKEDAIPVAKAAASDTIRFLFQTQVTLARQTLAEAQKAVSQADASLQKFYKDTGLVLPERSYDIKEQQISSLQQRELAERAAGNLTAAAALSQAITEQQAELKRLAPQLAIYKSLTERKTNAEGRLNVVQQNVEAAVAQYKAADPSAAITMNQAKPVSRLVDLVRKAGPAAGAGLFLAVGLVVLLEAIARRPGPDRRRDERQAASSSSQPLTTGSSSYRS